MKKIRSAIKLLVLDVDGVLTDGSFWYDAKGNEQKAFHTLDGLGLKKMQQAGITVAVISGRSSPAVTRRMQELSIPLVYQGVQQKIVVFEKLLAQVQVDGQSVASIGDDLPDLPIMERSGLPIAVYNAVETVKKAAVYCTTRCGGQGAVREACDWILDAI